MRTTHTHTLLLLECVRGCWTHHTCCRSVTLEAPRGSSACVLLLPSLISAFLNHFPTHKSLRSPSPRAWGGGPRLTRMLFYYGKTPPERWQSYGRPFMDLCMDMISVFINQRRVWVSNGSSDIITNTAALVPTLITDPYLFNFGLENWLLDDK